MSRVARHHAARRKESKSNSRPVIPPWRDFAGSPAPFSPKQKPLTGIFVYLTFLSHRVFQRFAGAELGNFHSRDLNLRSGLWVHALSSFAIGNNKSAKTGESHFVVFLQRLSYSVQNGLQTLTHLPLGQTTLGRYSIN